MLSALASVSFLSLVSQYEQQRISTQSTQPDPTQPRRGKTDQPQERLLK